MFLGRWMFLARQLELIANFVFTAPLRVRPVTSLAFAYELP